MLELTMMQDDCETIKKESLAILWFCAEQHTNSKQSEFHPLPAVQVACKHVSEVTTARV